MAAELQQPGSPGTATVAASDNPGAALVPKRQRRPSVRLGDIGDQSAATWRLSGKTSKTRPLTNLVTPNSDYSTDTATTTPTPTPHNNGKFKSRRTTNSAKRLRTRIEPAPEDTENADNVSFHDDEEGFRDFAPEGSEQEQRSPVHSGALLDAWHPHNRMSIRAANAGAASGSHRHLGIRLGLELDDGVRNWLVGLGLGRYAPVFEIHEVDDEVLPHLTLEDLKDMGINAVGSRRKLYSAILNLQKGLLEDLRWTDLHGTKVAFLVQKGADSWVRVQQIQSLCKAGCRHHVQIAVGADSAILITHHRILASCQDSGVGSSRCRC